MEGVVKQPDNRPPKQFGINECEKHCKLRLVTVTVGVDLGRAEKLRFFVDTGAEISVVRGTRLRPGLNYEPTKGINTILMETLLFNCWLENILFLHFCIKVS